LLWYELKRGGASALIVINLGLLVWALRAHFRKFALPDRFFSLMLLSPAVAAVQVVAGITMYTVGFRPPLMHVLYGVLIGLGATGQLLLRRGTGLWQKYRAKAWVYAFLALFVGLLSARSWMAARM
jgi:hypothetical protein